MNLEKEKNKIFENAKTELKKHFVGLDEIIDRLFESIRVWWFMPEILNRPIIINLWGMTGVGKTDLIRRLVKLLEIEKKYVEIQLNTDSNTYNNQIQDRLSNNGINYNDQSILFLDEFQRFGQKDKDNQQIRDIPFYDLWELLSDGKFSDSYKYKNDLYNLLIELLYDKDSEREEDKNNKNRKYLNSSWSASRFKQKLLLDLSVEDIMKLSVDEKIEMIQKQLDSNIDIEFNKYNKLLIVISGNLDDAYPFSKSTSEVDIDADIMHNLTKNINILNIKQSLLKKFAPEQIARLGNNHICYPSLNKNSFIEVINRHLNLIKINVKSKFNINIEFDDYINKVIYRNGVYPALGVRPLLGTIITIIENPLTNIIYYIKNHKLDNNIYLTIDDKNNKIIVLNSKKEFLYSVNIILQLDEVRNLISDNNKCHTLVHELGHTLLYMINYGVIPKQIIDTSISSDNVSGFVMPHSITMSKNNAFKKIEILCAGRIGEKLIFGENNITFGSNFDIKMATEVATALVRTEGMGNVFGTYLKNQEYSSFITDVESTDIDVKHILNKCYKMCYKKMKKYKKLYKDLIKEFKTSNYIYPERIFEISKRYIKNIKLVPHNYIITSEYTSLVDKFIGV